MTAARWVSLIIGILLMPYKFEAENPKEGAVDDF